MLGCIQGFSADFWSIISKCEIVGGSGIGSPVSQSVPILLGYHHILPDEM